VEPRDFSDERAYIALMQPAPGSIKPCRTGSGGTVQPAPGTRTAEVSGSIS
jgi:hypothetical protein